jgi:hypothetical protein
MTKHNEEFERINRDYWLHVEDARGLNAVSIDPAK